MLAAPRHRDLGKLWTVVAFLFVAALAAGVGFHASNGSAPDAASTSPVGLPSAGGTVSPAGTAPVPVTAAVPAATPALSDLGASPAAIELSWTDTTTGTFENYTVEEADPASSGTFSAVGVITSAATTSYVLSDLSPSVDYGWQVDEHYETCFLGCNQGTAVSNTLDHAQPPVAFLNDTGVTSSSATLDWTNNATYGGSIAFQNYTVWEETNGSAPGLVDTITLAATTQYVAALQPLTSYSFLVITADCTAGCGGSTPTDSVTQSNLVTLGTPAKLAVTLDAKRSVVDFGEADYFTCTPTGGASPFHYEWDVAGTGNVSGNASESVEIGALGPVTVTCWVTDAEPKVSGRSVSVQINPTLVVIDDANRTAADVGQSVQFECSVTGGSEPYSLGWSFGDGGTSALSTVSYSYSAAGDYAPACSVTDAAGVTSAPAMTIAVSPRLDVRANVTSTAVAPGTPLAFSATATNGTGDYTSFTWSFGSGATVSGQDVSHTFTSAGDVSISVGVVDSNGATATSVVSVDVSPIRMAASPSTTSLTVQGSVTFTAIAAGGAGGPYNYTWNFGDGSVGWGASVTHQYSTIGTMDPTLTVTDHLGATNTTTLPSIAVSAAKPPNSWATGWFALAVALLIGAIIAIVVLARRRKSEAKEAQSASSAYVPPTDPKKTIRGAKLCEFCGASNLPIRTTCSSCGKPLPRAPVS